MGRCRISFNILQQFEQGRPMPSLSREGPSQLIGKAWGLGHLISSSTDEWSISGILATACRSWQLCTRDRDPGFISRRDDRVAIQQKASPSVDSQAFRAGSLHHLDSLETDNGYIEAHILLGLSDLYDGQAAAQSRSH
jgi:hypothetical protein